jgi:uncharacterized glyoxalase superfamily protein PhnB
LASRTWSDPSASIPKGWAGRSRTTTRSPKKAGGKILKPAAKLQWGGYGGSFADPDGYIWNIGYSAEGKDQPYAE